MPTHKVARDASKHAGSRASGERIHVLDPELQVRDGGLKGGSDKDIDLELKDPSGTCEANVEMSSEVFKKHKVTWKIANNCRSERKVKVVFGYSEGSPLEPCTLEATVEQHKKGKIKCTIRKDAIVQAYRYDVVVTVP
jgi:hypothetical protein